MVLVLAGVALGRSHVKKHELVGSVTVARDGLPLTLAELDAWYVEPPQNAATFHLQGFDALQIHCAGSSNAPLIGKGKLPSPGVPVPAPMKSDLAAIAHANQEALHFFAQGAKYEQSRYPVDLTLGLDTSFPHLPRLKNAALLMELIAILHAEANDGTKAANDVMTALGLARSLEAEPALLSQLVRAAGVSIAVAALEQTVNRTTLPQESLTALFTTLQKMEDYEARGEGFTRGLAAEHATSMALLQTPQKLVQALTAPGVNAEQRNQVAARLQQSGKLKEEQQYFEEAFQQLMTARKEAFPDRLKADDFVRRCVTEAADKKLVIPEMLLAGLAGRAVTEAECLARLRLGLTAVALEEFRAAHDNRYPAALSGLTPTYLSATPIDPFTGQALHYRTKGNGYLLYSVGRDLKDDSGERINSKEGDIVFAVITLAKPGK